MSTTTSYLQLTLPAVSERLSLPVINQNWQKIDDFVGTTRYEVNTGVSSQSALDAILDAALTAGAQNSQILVRATMSASFGLFLSGEVYLADIRKTVSVQYSTAIIMRTGGQDVIKATRGTNGWNYTTLFSGTMPPVTIPNNGDANNYTTPGQSFIVTNSSAAATISNLPVATSGGRLDVFAQYSNTTYIRQIYTAAGVGDIYTRIYASNSWGAWERVVLKSEIDGTIKKSITTILSGNSATFNVTNNARALFVLNGANSKAQGFVVFACSSTGEGTKKLIGDPYANVTSGTNTVTIENTSGVQMNVEVIVSVGTVTLA